MGGYNVAEVLRSVRGKTFAAAFGREPTAREGEVIAAHRMAKHAREIAQRGCGAIALKPAAPSLVRDAQDIGADADRELAAVIVKACELEIARRVVRDAIGRVRQTQVGYLYGRAFEDQARAAGLDRAILVYRMIQSIEPAAVQA